MRKVSLFMMFFLIVVFSVFGQEMGGFLPSDKESSGGLIQDDIYGDYFLFSAAERVSLDLEEARLIDVLKMLSQQTDLNFISTEAVRDRMLTAYLKKVPLKKAMDILFKANNLAYEFYPEADMFVVKEMGKPTIELKTKIYHLKDTRISSSWLEREIEDKLAPEDEGEYNRGEEEEDAYGIRDAVEKVLTEVGRVSEDPISNSLIVVDVPSQFPIIDEVVDRLDAPPTQVVIEAELLDVSKSTLDALGFKWNNGITGAFTGGSRTSKFPFRGAWAGPYSAGTLDLTNFQLTMEFLEQNTSAKFLARPKIVTLSNQTAEINLTADEVIGLTETTDGEGNITQDVERAETGTKLRVTPHVNPSTDEITMMIEVFNRASTDSGLSLANLSGGNLKNVEERGTRQVVRLDEGETLYIGGLIKNQEKEVITKVPFLGDLPLIGALFRHKNKPAADNEERELMVFLTPRIISSKGQFAQKLNSKVFLKREQIDLSRQSSVDVALDQFSKQHRD